MRACILPCTGKCTGNKNSLGAPTKSGPHKNTDVAKTEWEVFAEVGGGSGVTRPRTFVCISSAWPSARAGSPPIAELLNAGPHLNILPYVLVSITA